MLEEKVLSLGKKISLGRKMSVGQNILSVVIFLLVEIISFSLGRLCRLEKEFFWLENFCGIRFFFVTWRKKFCWLEKKLSVEKKKLSVGKPFCRLEFFFVGCRKRFRWLETKFVG